MSDDHFINEEENTGLDAYTAKCLEPLLDGPLSEREDRKLRQKTDEVLHENLRAHLTMDALLQVAYTDEDALGSIYEAIEASVLTKPAAELSDQILATVAWQSSWLLRFKSAVVHPVCLVWPAAPQWTSLAAAVAISLGLGVLLWNNFPDARKPTGLVQVAPSKEEQASDVTVAIPAVVSPLEIPSPTTPGPAFVIENAPITEPSMVQPDSPVVASSAHLPVQDAFVGPPYDVSEMKIATIVDPKSHVMLASPSPKQESVRIKFESEVLPILERSCFECHSGKIKKPKGGIRLDDLATIRAKSRTGNLVLPHKPEKSALVKSISLPSDSEDIMPPADKGKSLSADEIDLIRRWVEQGADFGTWTSAQAREVKIQTTGEKIEADHIAATAARIDELIEANLEKNQKKPNALASETTWLRRVYLDLMGRIPTISEIESFSKAPAANKKEVLIDKLLKSKGHVSHNFNYWTALLRARDALADGVDGSHYLMWIKQCLQNNKPYDVWAREILSPEGYGWNAPAVGYYLRDGVNRAANIESTATVFLGTQIACAQCHDHPYDQWTRKDYHQFLGWTSGIKTSEEQAALGGVSGEELEALTQRNDRRMDKTSSMRLREQFEKTNAALLALKRSAGGQGLKNGEGELAVLPKDYQYEDGKPEDLLEPAVLFGEEPDTKGRRTADAFADWVTSDKNPRFALVLANRLWAQLFGLPFAGPLDQVRQIEDCPNPDLAQYLTEVVKSARYDMRKIQHIFCMTRAYQREASLPPENSETVYHFPGPVVRRLSAEQVWDSMMTLAVVDLDEKMSFEVKDSANLVAATQAEKMEDVTRIVQKMIADEKSEMKSGQRLARIRGDMAEEFAGGNLERASELPQPTPEGHFLRMFGQGSRDSINDNWSVPTVPQSLLMLNSEFFDKVARSNSPLMNALQRERGNPRSIIRYAFLATLSREPTAAEIKACLETLGESRNPKPLTRTLLTTAEFIFQK